MRLVIKNVPDKTSGKRDVFIDNISDAARWIFEYSNYESFLEDEEHGVEIPCDITKADTWQKMLDSGLAKHQYLCGGRIIFRDYLLAELVMSEADVPKEVLDCVLRDGVLKHGRKQYSNLDRFLSLADNASAVRWLLEKGCVYKKIKGYGQSTMERVFWVPRVEEEKEARKKIFAVIMCHMDAVDMSYIKSHPLVMAECYAYYCMQPDAEDIVEFLKNLLLKAEESLR